MIYKSKELREQRANLVKQMQDMAAEAKAAGVSLSADQIAKWDDLDNAQKKLLEEAEGYERLESLDAMQEQLSKAQFKSNPKTATETVTRRDAVNALKGFFLAPSENGASSEMRLSAEKAGIDLNGKFFKLDLNDRPVKTRLGSSGVAQSHLVSTRGVELVKEEMADHIEDALKAWGGVREAATIYRTATGGPMPFPSGDDTGETGVRVSENSEMFVESLAFSEKTLNAYKYTSKLIKVPVELMQDSAFDIVGYIGKKLGERIGKITNYEFTTLSSTAGGPVGILSASGGATALSGGQDTAQYTAITYQENLNLIHGVNAAYRKSPKAGFMFNDSSLKLYKQMVDSQNRPLWVAGVGVGEPDRICGYQYFLNYDMPDPALNAKAIAFGDWSQYVIRDVQGITIQRLDERYAEFGQVCFLATSRHDGKFINPSTVAPVKYLTMGSTT